MKRLLLAFILSLGLCGCAMSGPAMDLTSNVVVLEPDRPDHDFKVYLRNVPLMDYDLNQPEDRVGFLKLYFDHCRDVSVVDVTFLQTGFWTKSSDRPSDEEPMKRGQYIMRVRCIR